MYLVLGLSPLMLQIYLAWIVFPIILRHGGVTTAIAVFILINTCFYTAINLLWWRQAVHVQLDAQDMLWAIQEAMVAGIIIALVLKLRAYFKEEKETPIPKTQILGMAFAYYSFCFGLGITIAFL